MLQRNVDVRQDYANGFTPITKVERDLQNITLTDRFQNYGIVINDSHGSAEHSIVVNRESILQAVATSGFCIVRGLGVVEPTGFRKCIEAMGFPLVEDYGDLPMLPSDDGTSGVFNVTKYPSKNAILFHNEGTHTNQPPRHIFFQCSVPAQQDGETPIANSADVLQALPVPIRDYFTEHGLLYRRNFIEGLDVSWTKYFGTDNRDDVESRCAKHNISVKWHPDGGLETAIHRPAVVQHPVSGVHAFINQVLLHHPACLDPAIRVGLQSMLNGRGFPRDVCFGDGSPIPDEWVAEVLRAHIRVAVTFRWQSGDIVIADNFSVAHARRPFGGARQHHVILGRA